MKRLTIGMLAHVDSGKTTLSESMLYLSGALRKLGRVDHRDAFLDTDQQERERGITIFSKQARLAWKDCEFTLLDTPGHVDFSAEMERAVQVLDYAEGAGPHRDPVEAAGTPPCARFPVHQQNGPAGGQPGPPAGPAPGTAG